MAFTLTVYLDESSSEYPYLASGWAARPGDWDIISGGWKTVLQTAPSVPYFKLNDALGLKGPFAGWSEPDRDAKLISFAQSIPHDGTIFGMGCHVRRDDFDKVKSTIPKKIYRDPYYFCVATAMVYAVAGENQIVGFDKIDFVLDQSDEAETMRKLFYKSLKLAFPKLGDCVTMDDKNTPPLQAADLSAGIVRQLYESNPRTIPGTYALEGLFSGIYEIRPKGLDEFISAGIFPGAKLS
jgi:hypothetical protein